MAKVNGAKTEPVSTEAAIADSAEVEAEIAPPAPVGSAPVPAANSQDMEETLNALKSLLSAVEKLQKVRQEVGDIKPALIRMLDGEVLTGEELEQLKLGVGGLFKLVRAHSDHQTALTNAQPARALLDQVLKSSGK